MGVSECPQHLFGVLNQALWLNGGRLVPNVLNHSLTLNEVVHSLVVESVNESRVQAFEYRCRLKCRRLNVALLGSCDDWK